MSLVGIERRLAINEGLFREVNDRIHDLNESSLVVEGEFVCECGDADCTETIRIPLREYKAVRDDTAEAFIVSLEHASSAMYEVLAVGYGYCVVHRVDTGGWPVGLHAG
jgi:hypothetical protein